MESSGKPLRAGEDFESYQTEWPASIQRLMLVQTAVDPRNAASGNIPASRMSSTGLSSVAAGGRISNCSVEERATTGRYGEIRRKRTINPTGRPTAIILRSCAWSLAPLEDAGLDARTVDRRHGNLRAMTRPARRRVAVGPWWALGGRHARQHAEALLSRPMIPFTPPASARFHCDPAASA